ncbi:hypothetical protein [Actinoplanes sp. NPDC049599]|uniref:hypothetical protein n=1 Tax=Actinoplanes sp. NPDC049599 TaxID=3363903 RepID=UPI0037B0C69C
MTDQDAMARLAAANPVPDTELAGAATSPRALSLHRAVLAQPRRRLTLPPAPRWRYALVPAALAAVAAAAFIVVHRGPPPRPPAVTSVATPQSILSAAAARAGQEGRRGQFVLATGSVARVVHLGAGPGYDVIRVDSVQSVQPADGLPGEGWVTIGEQGSSVRPLTAAGAAAYASDGSPGPAELPADDDRGLHPDLAGDQAFAGELGELPDDPAATGPAMLAWLAEAGLTTPADPQGWLFRTGTKLLDTFTGRAGGADRAKIFRMLAGLTGVRTLDAGADPLGRPARALAYTAPTQRYGLVEWQVYLGPDSDRITYTQAVVRQPGPDNAGLPAGAVQYSTAVTAVAWSDKP